MTEQNVSRRKYLAAMGGLGAAAVLGWGAAGYFASAPPAPGPTQTVTQTVTETLTGGPTTAAPSKSVKDWVKEVAKPYSGTEIHVTTEGTPPSVWVNDEVVPGFEELTGIKVTIDLVGWDEAVRKATLDAQAGEGKWDLYYIDMCQLVDLFGPNEWVVDIYKMMKDHPELTYPDLNVDDFIPNKFFTDSKGHLIGLPFENYAKCLWYRQDLFNDPKEKEAFKTKYGYDLIPATTWEEYRDIAEFFTRPADRMYGHICMPAPLSSMNDFHENLYTYGIPAAGVSVNRKATVKRGGRMDSDVAITWMKEFVELFPFSPPGVHTFAWEESAGEFLSGRGAQAILWADSMANTINPEISKVVGKVGCAPMPINPKYMIWNLPKQYGDMGTWAISAFSENKEAAYIFSQYLTSPEMARQEMEYMGTMCTRKSLLFSPLAEQIDRKFNWRFYQYLQDWIRLGDIYGPWEPMREGMAVIDTVIKWAPKAYTGEMSAEETMRSCAEEVDQKTAEMGWPN